MEDCIFCKIGAVEIPSEAVYEDEKLFAFLDINPVAAGHTLLIPKKHFTWFYDMPDDISDEFFRVAKRLAIAIKKATNADYIHLSIVGKDVPHAHLHLIPRMLKDNPQLEVRKKRTKKGDNSIATIAAKIREAL